MLQTKVTQAHSAASSNCSKVAISLAGSAPQVSESEQMAGSIDFNLLIRSIVADQQSTLGLLDQEEMVLVD